MPGQRVWSPRSHTGFGRIVAEECDREGCGDVGVAARNCSCGCATFLTDRRRSNAQAQRFIVRYIDRSRTD